LQLSEVRFRFVKQVPDIVEQGVWPFGCTKQVCSAVRKEIHNVDPVVESLG